MGSLHCVRRELVQGRPSRPPAALKYARPGDKRQAWGQAVTHHRRPLRKRASLMVRHLWTRIRLADRTRAHRLSPRSPP
jgi:hypothetical protein